MSAPRPVRSSSIACPASGACSTLAPFSKAILVAAESWPARFPIMRTRMGFPLGVRILDDLGHGHAEAVVDNDDFAPRNQTRVDVDIDRPANPPIEFQHRTRAELEQF